MTLCAPLDQGLEPSPVLQEDGRPTGAAPAVAP
jgi:hypothetical protein